MLTMKSATRKKCGVHAYDGNYPLTNFDKCERASLISRCRDLHDRNSSSHLNSDLSVVIGLIRKLYQCTNPGKATLQSIVIRIYARSINRNRIDSCLSFTLIFATIRSIKIKIFFSTASLFFFITVHSILILSL